MIDALEIVVFNEDPGVLIKEFKVQLDQTLNTNCLVDKGIPPENDVCHEWWKRRLCHEIEGHITQFCVSVYKGVILKQEFEVGFCRAFRKASDLIALTDTKGVVGPMKICEVIVNKGNILCCREPYKTILGKWARLAH